MWCHEAIFRRAFASKPYKLCPSSQCLFDHFSLGISLFVDLVGRFSGSIWQPFCIQKCCTNSVAHNDLIIWVALRKNVPNGLSRSHTKRRAGERGRARHSFMYDTDFSGKQKSPKYLKKKKSKKVGNFSD